MVDLYQAQVAAAVAEAVDWGKTTEAALRPETVEVLTRSQDSDGMGGTTDTWNVAVTLQGRLQASTKDPQDVNLGGGLHVRQLWEVVLPAGTVIASTARLRISGRSYAVVADDRERSYSSSVHVLCYEV
jgi:hypothetical protein